MFGFHRPVQEVREEAYRQEGTFGGSRIILTTDPTHPGLRELQPNMQQVAYLVMPDDEIDLGFVRPLRRSYKHLACDAVTQMGLAIAETFARRPCFYSDTFCARCRRHFPLKVYDDSRMIPQYQFVWEDGTPVGA